MEARASLATVANERDDAPREGGEQGELEGGPGEHRRLRSVSRLGQSEVSGSLLADARRHGRLCRSVDPANRYTRRA